MLVVDKEASFYRISVSGNIFRSSALAPTPAVPISTAKVRRRVAVSLLI